MERYLKDYAVASFGVSVALFLVIATVLPSAQTLCAPNTVCVTTWHNDNYRTGDNLNEATLTYSTVSKDNFGQRCFAALDGQVYAQPLVVPKVTIGSIKYNYVVYVVTQNDTFRETWGTRLKT
jgi:hypothetical protein